MYYINYKVQTIYIVLAKVTTQQDYSIDQSQSSYMDPQTQIKPKDVSLAHVSSNNQHLACFHCQDEAFEETMVGEEARGRCHHTWALKYVIF